MTDDLVPEDFDLDEAKRELDRTQRDSVSRSQVGREALAVGLVALDELNSERELRHLDTRERRSLARRGMQLAVRESMTGDVPEPGADLGDE